MKKLSFFLLCLFITACGREDLKEINPAEETGNSYAITSGDAELLLKDFLGDLPATKGQPMKIITSRVLQYDIPDIVTDKVSVKAGKIPVYQLATTDGKEQGYSLVIGDERIGKVIAFVADGSLADTAHIPPLKWFIESIPTIINSDLLSYYDGSREKKEKRPRLAKELLSLARSLAENLLGANRAI